MKNAAAHAAVKDLRRFGFLMAAAFAVVAILPTLFRGGPPRRWALALAVAFAAVAAVRPPLLAPVHAAWMRLGHVLGWINTRLILGVAFFLIITPIGIVLRWLGKDPMRRRFDRAAESYRIPRTERPGSHMEHQF